MAKAKNVKIPQNLFIVIVAAAVIIGFIVLNLLSNYFLFLRRAHSSFENYYAFRGCKQLLQKTDNFGICKTDSGDVIKIVLYEGRWYLDGDLPVCYFNVCL